MTTASLRRSSSLLRLMCATLLLLALQVEHAYSFQSHQQQQPFLVSSSVFVHSLTPRCQNKITAVEPVFTTALFARPTRLREDGKKKKKSRSSNLYQSSVGVEVIAADEATTAISTTADGSTSQPPLESLQESDLTKKVLNALLLAASFGFAAYTIFSIDDGMTRGWTNSEIAMRIPLDNWLNYENSLADRPIFTKTAINVIIYLLGDWLSQTAFSGKNVLDFDAGRTLRNGFIGLCFGPLVHEYYQFSDHILPVEGGMWNRLEKICMDQTVYLTIKCSVYIAAVGLLQGDPVEDVKNNVKTKLPDIVVTAWKFWPLVHLVTYGIIPARHRILWVNCVDLVWNAILASMSQAKPEEEVAALEISSATAMNTTDVVVLMSVDEDEDSGSRGSGAGTVLTAKPSSSSSMLQSSSDVTFAVAMEEKSSTDETTNVDVVVDGMDATAMLATAAVEAIEETATAILDPTTTTDSATKITTNSTVTKD